MTEPIQKRNVVIADEKKDMDEHWYVLYTKSRSEKKVAERLREMGWQVFCPLKEEWHQWSDRRKKVMEPFFRSYVFVRFNYIRDRIAVLNVPGVVRFLFLVGKPALIWDEEMDTVIEFFNRYNRDEILQEVLEIGKAVAVKGGFLAGMSGIVVWQNKYRVMLDIPGMNMRFCVEKRDLDI